MARTGFIHHVGTFLLFAATILLIITCISAPVVNNIAILKVRLNGSNGSGRSDENIAFGTFGWCLNNANGGDGDECSQSQVGYNPAAIVRDKDQTQFSDYAEDTTRGLTKALVLNPIACGLNFIAFLLALGSGFVGSLLASLVAGVAFLVTLVALIIEFALFSIIKSNISDNNAGSDAEYGSAAWTTLVAAIFSLFATVILFFTCCSARLHNRRQARSGMPVKEGYTEPTRRRRRWF